MNTRKLALLITLVTPVLLAAGGFADRPQEHADETGASGQRARSLSPASCGHESSPGVQPAMSGPAATIPPAAEPELAPSCRGVAHCAVEAVKAAVGESAAVAAAALYFGLAPGLVFLP
jgi:hypothetical protein